MMAVRRILFWFQVVGCALLLAACGGSDGAGPDLSQWLKAGTVEPQTGMWWNPSESGRGYAVERQGSTVTLGAYMYESNGQPVWYVGLLNRQADSSYQGQIARYGGGQTLTGTYRAPASASTVATVTFTVGTATSGTLTFVTPSATQAVPVQRLALTANGVAASGASFESGLWWNEAESGRGFFLDVQANTVGMASYMYDASGQPIWYLTAAQFTGSSFSGSLLSYLDGQTLGGAYRAARGAGSSGTLGFRGLSATTAEITLPDGRVIPVKRLVFASSNTGQLEGAFEGSVTRTGESQYMTLFALDNGELWLVAGEGEGRFQKPVGLALVSGSSAAGAYTSTALRDFGDGGVVQTGTFSGTYSAGASAAGTLRLDGQSSPYTITTQALPGSRYTYAQAASMTAVVGAWPVQSSTGLSGSLSVTAAGAVSGSFGACAVSGTLTVRPGGRNVFDAAITATGGGIGQPACFSGSGIAFTTTSATGASQLWLGFVDAARTQGVMLLGQR